MKRRLTAAACALIVIAAACGESAAEETTTTTTSTAATTTTTVAETTTTTVAATTTTEPSTLSAQEVFTLVSPALGFIENTIGSGSGVVYRDGLLVTNFHVVWPDTAVRVTFPDGSEIRQAPVVATDRLADLAIVDISELDGAPPPVSTGSAEGFAIGSELFLIGYPGETDEFPNATITQGILSRIREAESFGLTYIQTDAVIAGGQSGGALVSDRGEVVGISGFGVEGFALATSMPDVEDLVERLLAGEQTDGLDRNDLTLSEPGTEFDITTDNFLHDVGFLIEEPSNTELTISGTSDEDLILALIAADGLIEAFADEDVSGEEELVFDTVLDAPHYLAANTYAFAPATIQIASNVEMRQIEDPDDGATLAVGARVTGAFDHPGDNDYFLVELVEGVTVEIIAESLLAIPSLIVDLAGNVGDPLAIADEGSGGGLFGTDQAITFTAPETDTYLVGVGDIAGLGPSAYLLTVTVVD